MTKPKRKLFTITSTEPIYLMNPMTGSVDTGDNWADAMACGEFDESIHSAEYQMATLIEVVKDENGDWQEVK